MESTFGMSESMIEAKTHFVIKQKKASEPEVPEWERIVHCELTLVRALKCTSHMNIIETKWNARQRMESTCCT